MSGMDLQNDGQNRSAFEKVITVILMSYVKNCTLVTWQINVHIPYDFAGFGHRTVGKNNRI